MRSGASLLQSMPEIKKTQGHKTKPKQSKRTDVRRMKVLYKQRKYDVSNFIRRHPGGAHVFRNLEGQDVTPFVHLYHPCLQKPEEVLKTLPSEPMRCTDHVSYSSSYPYDYTLYLELKERVRSFVDAHLSTSKWTWRNWFRHAWMGVVYCWLAFLYLTGPTFCVCVFLGVWSCCFLSSVCHEALHNSVSRTPLVNQCLGYGMLPFLSPSLWDVDHNILHHGHVNTDTDNDFALFRSGMGRNSRSHPYRPWYRFLYLYMWPLACLVMMKKGIYKSVRCMGHYSKHADADSIAHCITFVAFFGYVGIVHGCFYPLLVLASFGLYFVCITQVNHITANNTRTDIDKQDFCINQIESSTNYRVSALSSFLFFGLNYQIEHHLFPGISTEHHGRIAEIVQAFCAEKNIRYNLKASYPAAFRDYFLHLVDCSKP